MPSENPTADGETLRDFISRLTTSDAEPIPESESWEQMIARIHIPQHIHCISEEIHDYFLEVLPPRWMRGPYFAFAEGQDPLQLFWTQSSAEQTDEHFPRQLTDDEIDAFCRLTELPRNYGCY
jgi:hypothetical protein